MLLWSSAIAAGIPDEVFWKLTPLEFKAVLDRREAEERAKYMRAGLIAATIVNVNRRQGAAIVNAEDFFNFPPKPEDYMSIEEATATMDAWAKTHNRIDQESAQ